MDIAQPQPADYAVGMYFEKGNDGAIEILDGAITGQPFDRAAGQDGDDVEAARLDDGNGEGKGRDDSACGQRHDAARPPDSYPEQPAAGQGGQACNDEDHEAAC